MPRLLDGLAESYKMRRENAGSDSLVNLYAAESAGLLKGIALENRAGTLMQADDFDSVLRSEQLPWAVRFALKLQRLGCAAELDSLFLMGRTLWLQHAATPPETVAREEWAAWPPQDRSSSTR